ncbi:MAG: phosphomannose isomerase type II C-terminal cupin domain, partial [Cyanobacteria bacterium J06635_13]
MSQDRSQNKNSVATELKGDATRNPPYGKVKSLDRGQRYCINKIEINPGEHMSTQMHYHRSEHWIVVSGTAKVICNGKETLVMANQSTYVPMN